MSVLTHWERRADDLARRDEEAPSATRATLIFDAPDVSVWTTLRRLRHRDVRIYDYRREALVALSRSAGLDRLELVAARGTTFVVSRRAP